MLHKQEEPKLWKYNLIKMSYYIIPYIKKKKHDRTWLEGYGYGV
jgi:hypothetical protein